MYINKFTSRTSSQSTRTLNLHEYLYTYICRVLFTVSLYVYFVMFDRGSKAYSATQKTLNEPNFWQESSGATDFQFGRGCFD